MGLGGRLKPLQHVISNNPPSGAEGRAHGGYFLALWSCGGGVMGRPPGFRPLNCIFPLVLVGGLEDLEEKNWMTGVKPPVLACLPRPDPHLEGAHERLVTLIMAPTLSNSPQLGAEKSVTSCRLARTRSFVFYYLDEGGGG